ncbi:hypothetical protein [Accumulibacter sp.]|uniref:hypothetical protein n=1 Tax=Accumulibacter sp. TaxID=2053492 RepID=UPI0025DFD9FB|nr:hypothetical protein [Accumulibacter sp.]MCM8612142.1 hypothetical protein [Accumulibacter sp.]MCM8635808.1 hypothetical protein [Accumulibacter sp.]MCM8639555.1 hypothetical protein [Accumulibacter sp.]
MRAWPFLLLPPLLAASLLPVLTERQPLVSRSDGIAASSIVEVRRLLANHDSGRLQDGDERTAIIPAGLLDTAIDHFASRTLGARAAFVIIGRSGELRLSIPLRGLPARRYLNLSAVIAAADGHPRIDSASLGALPLPGWLAEAAAGTAIRAAGLAGQWQVAARAVRRVDFDAAASHVVLNYVWQPELLEQLRPLAVTPADMANLRNAQAALAGLLDHRAGVVPLGQVLTPLLACCGEASAGHGRAALLVLAAHVSGNSLSRLLPEARSWARPRRVKLSLHGRHDSAQHFVVSAALAAWAGESAADAIGLDKEMRDARSGSGFSFADLAADRAGSRFGELVAANSPRLQAALQRPLSDSDLAPSLAGLPEGLSAAEFERRFAAPESADYRQVKSEIERRLRAMPLYR